MRALLLVLGFVAGAYPPLRSGGGGPPKAGEGAATARIQIVVQPVSEIVGPVVAAAAPSTTLRVVPLPRFAGEDARPILIAQSDVPGDLHDVLMNKLKTMDAKGKGVFHEDITPVVSHLFPIGQPYRETEKIVAQRKLGALRRFQGKHDADVAMFVTKFDVMLQTYGTAYVVVDFDFSGTGPDDMKLVHMHAFMRTTDM